MIQFQELRDHLRFDSLVRHSSASIRRLHVMFLLQAPFVDDGVLRSVCFDGFGVQL